MNELPIPKEGILVNLDAILDTRLGVLSSFGDDETIAVLESNYFKRETDSFKGISDSDFKERYKNRDKTTLLNSIACKSLNMLRELARNTARQAISSPFHAGTKIFLNTYPYVLTEEENNVLITAVVHSTNSMVDVEVVNMSDDKITPAFIKENISVAFFYEYGNWLDTNAEAFKVLPCPEVTVFVPALYFGKVPTPKELQECRENKTHPFTITEQMSSGLIGLQLLSIDMFCASLK